MTAYNFGPFREHDPFEAQRKEKRAVRLATFARINRQRQISRARYWKKQLAAAKHQDE